MQYKIQRLTAAALLLCITATGCKNLFSESTTQGAANPKTSAEAISMAELNRLKNKFKTGEAYLAHLQRSDESAPYVHAILRLQELDRRGAARLAILSELVRRDPKAYQSVLENQLTQTSVDPIKTFLTTISIYALKTMGQNAFMGLMSCLKDVVDLEKVKAIFKLPGIAERIAALRTLLGASLTVMSATLLSSLQATYQWILGAGTLVQTYAASISLTGSVIGAFFAVWYAGSTIIEAYTLDYIEKDYAARLANDDLYYRDVKKFFSQLNPNAFDYYFGIYSYIDNAVSFSQESKSVLANLRNRVSTP